MVDRRAGPAASTASSELAAPVEEARGVAARGPVVEVELDLLEGRGRPRSASMVIRTSQPKPEASGKQAARARAPTSRWPESGSRGAAPVRRRTSSRPTRLAIPKPPPTRRRKAATARSASLSASGRSEPRRSASARSSGPGAAARSPAESASPFPSRSTRSTTRPAASARSAVPVLGAPVDDDHLGVGKVASAGRPRSRRSAPPRSAPGRGSVRPSKSELLTLGP